MQRKKDNCVALELSQSGFKDWLIKDTCQKISSKTTVKHQKGRRVPMNLQSRDTIGLDCLQQEGHIKNLSKCSPEHFISPKLNTVKKYQSKKLA